MMEMRTFTNKNFKLINYLSKTSSLPTAQWWLKIMQAGDKMQTADSLRILYSNSVIES